MIIYHSIMIIDVDSIIFAYKQINESEKQTLLLKSPMNSKKNHKC